MNFKSYNDLSNDIKNNISKIHTGNYDLVVGFPRSGMTPAHMIALYLNTHVTDFESFLNNKSLKCGLTRNVRVNIKKPHDAENILLVDDSIYSGNSIKKSLNKIPTDLKNKSTTLAVYSNIPDRNDIDLYLDVVSTPRVFEWNIFHHSVLRKACVDIDGVLCIDPTSYENDDGDKYINFLQNAKPKILPTMKINSLVTSRLEKYRTHTETWLKKHNIEYDNLIMLDLPSKEERIKQQSHAIHKAKYYMSNSKLELFIESDIKQSYQITHISGKPVFCVDSNKIINPSMLNSAFKNPVIYKPRLKFFLRAMTPLWIKKLLKPILSLFRFFYKKKT